MGLDMTVSLVVKYKLVELGTGQVVWEKQIFSEYTATISDALAGSTRLRKANEGAVRRNLAQLLGELTALNL